VRSSWTSARSLLFAVVVIAGAGCGSSANVKAGIAPLDGRSVAQSARPLLAQFSLQVQRSSVAEMPGPRGGSELNLYVRPARGESADLYASRFMPLAAAIVPTLLAKYPEIKWLDLCQEPAKSSGTWETVPVTRLEISRDGSGHVDWERRDLASVLALSRTRPLELSIEWHNGIGRTPVWSAAAARALTLDG
jgi:hypothetical protein